MRTPAADDDDIEDKEWTVHPLGADDGQTLPSEREVETRAAEAAVRIERGQHWDDWMTVAEGLLLGRQNAMRRADTNSPTGKGYAKAFGDWLNERTWARGFDNKTRSDLFWCADHRLEIETWRETLAANERVRLNHPTAMKRRFEEKHRVSGAKEETARETRETPYAKLQRELDATLNRCDALQRKLEEVRDDDGPPFSMSDSPAQIARGLAEHLNFNKLVAVQRAIDKEIGERGPPGHGDAPSPPEGEGA
jgi:hypothetical protein